MSFLCFAFSYSVTCPKAHGMIPCFQTIHGLVHSLSSSKPSHPFLCAPVLILAKEFISSFQYGESQTEDTALGSDHSSWIGKHRWKLKGQLEANLSIKLAGHGRSPSNKCNACCIQHWGSKPYHTYVPAARLCRWKLPQVPWSRICQYFQISKSEIPNSDIKVCYALTVKCHFTFPSKWTAFARPAPTTLLKQKCRGIRRYVCV